MTTQQTFKVHNRILERNTEITIDGEAGRFKFISMNASDGSITCFGGRQGYGMFRSFMPDRIKRVHYKKKMR
jgi:hypothetical protein